MLGFINFNSLTKSNKLEVVFSSKEKITKTAIKEVKKDFITAPFEKSFPTKSEIETSAKNSLEEYKNKSIKNINDDVDNSNLG